MNFSLVAGVYLYQRRDHLREDIEKVLMAAVKVAYGESSSNVVVFVVDHMQQKVGIHPGKLCTKPVRSSQDLELTPTPLVMLWS